MNSLTLRDLRAAGYRLEIECVRCGNIEHRCAGSLHDGPATPVGALGLDLDCRFCGARACITSPAPSPGDA